MRDKGNDHTPPVGVRKPGVGGPPGIGRRRFPRRRRARLLWIRPAGTTPPDDIRLYYTLRELLRLASIVASELERLGGTEGEDRSGG